MEALIVEINAKTNRFLAKPNDTKCYVPVWFSIKTDWFWENPQPSFFI
jgi:hypothetical protein